MKNSKLNFITKTAMLSVLGFLLMFIEVPIPIFPSFLKMDISDLPALIGAFALGPMSGVIIELIKNVLHGTFVGGSAFIGELANFLVGSVLVLTAGYIYRIKKSKRNAVLSLFLGTISMSIGACILDYFIVFPLYEKVLHFPITAVVAMGTKLNPYITDFNGFIAFSILPFNILKGILISAITLAVYKSVSPLIHNEMQKTDEKKGSIV